MPIDASGEGGPEGEEGGNWSGADEFEVGGPKRRAQTKEQQIYGVWADDDDDDESHNRRSAAGGAKDLSRPVGFVSTSFAMPAPEPVPEAETPQSTVGVGSAAADAPSKRDGRGLPINSIKGIVMDFRSLIGCCDEIARRPCALRMRRSGFSTSPRKLSLYKSSRLDHSEFRR